MSRFVPRPTSEVITNRSAFFLMFGSPIPAPKPISRISGVAVEYPSCMARLMSGMPGPSSRKRRVKSSGVTRRVISARSAYMTTFISAS